MEQRGPVRLHAGNPAAAANRGGPGRHPGHRMGDTVNANWHHGNAAEDGQPTRGWLLGAFIDPAEGVRSTKDVEVKWGIHPPGDKRAAWTADDQRTTMVI